MTVGTWVLIGVVVVAIVGMLVQGKRMRWYLVSTADNNQIKLYRKMGDWWFGDSRNMMLFHYPDGHRVKIQNHWILKIEEIVGEETK